MFSLESPHRGDCDEYTQYTIFNIYTKIAVNYPISAAMCFFQGTQERVRKSGGKRVISVRATEVLLYIERISKQIQLNIKLSSIFQVCDLDLRSE